MGRWRTSGTTRVHNFVRRRAARRVRRRSSFSRSWLKAHERDHNSLTSATSRHFSSLTALQQPHGPSRFSRSNRFSRFTKVQLTPTTEDWGQINTLAEG